MNSYPPELLAQLAPVMFVAGLDPPQPAPNPSSTSPVPPPKSSDPFQVLSTRLRDALLAHRKVAIWQPEKNKSFQVILVDKDVKFPPRKLVPPDDPQYSTAHSPLSPLSQTSPLHPDGLMAPIWIRKHTSLVPSVFVLFLRIFEYPPYASRAPLDFPDAAREREREAEERRRDSELAAEVAQRKKITSERGIKLTVVLMASRKMLDDPTLDSRLTFIRRQSGLDSRAALFVLSPVSLAELNDFVRSLQQALYDPAVEYYTAHSKRVRRKRNRHSQTSSGYPNPTSTLGNIARPLRPEGWTVRYEYKMACFAEFRGEDEVALKHYQDAYEMLLIMFGSTAILPPRTKRWAEAKVLADCINIKTVKLYLYNNEHALALSHHSTHIRHFGDFSRGWGIGEETFEFWSWIARQYRVLAELLEQGTRSTLVIPVHKPALPSSNPSQSQQNLRANSGVEYDTLRSLGINPSHALQHPGFYYYTAARCTEMRRSRFLAVVESEISHKPAALSPGYTNEKKVEHLAIINELYTKSYELFKKHCSSSNQGQGRLTLLIAYRIAQTYYDDGKFDMAVRFLERIAKTYRREKWYSMLRPLLSMWHACAKQLGDVELGIKLLVEMLGHDDPDSDDPSSLEKDLMAILKNTVPSAPDTAVVADLVEAHPIFDSNVVFWSSEVKVGEPAAFQLTMTAPTSISIELIPFSHLTLHLSDDSPPIVVHHAPSDVQLPIQRVDMGHATHVEGQNPPVVTGNLRWQPGGTIVFTGSISSEVPLVLKIATIVLTIEENGWKVNIPFEPCSIRPGSGPMVRWLSSVDPPQFIPVKRTDYSSTLVKHRAHQLRISFHHEGPAYLDQDYPIIIEVTNADIRDLDVVVNILLQPTEIDDAVNWIVIDDIRSSSLIKGVQLGVLAPGVTIVKTLHLFNTGASGDRMIDISIQSGTTVAGKHESDQTAEDHEDDDDEDNDGETTSHDTMEHLHMIVIPTTNPFKLTHSVAYRHALDPWSGLANLETFDEAFWDDRRGGEALVIVILSCVGPSSLNIESLRLERRDSRSAKIINSSMDEQDDDMFPAEFIQGDEISGSCTISFSLEDERDQDTIDGPGRYVVTWDRILQNGTHGPKAISFFSLPSLRPPVGSIVALLDVPPRGTLHVPMSLTLTIRNYHPTRSANIVVQLEPDSMDGFVVSGLRNGRVPLLLPGSEEKLVWNILPIECGYVTVPRIKIVDRRKAISSSQEPDANTDAFAGDVIKVVDLRREMQHDEGGVSIKNQISIDEQEKLTTVLVLP